MLSYPKRAIARQLLRPDPSTKSTNTRHSLRWAWAPWTPMRVLAKFRRCNVRFFFRASASTWRSTSTAETGHGENESLHSFSVGSLLWIGHTFHSVRLQTPVFNVTNLFVTRFYFDPCGYAAHICQPSSTHVGWCDTRVDPRMATRSTGAGLSSPESQASASLSPKSFQLRSRSTRFVVDFRNAAMAWPKRNMTSRYQSTVQFWELFGTKRCWYENQKQHPVYQQQWREKRRMRQWKGYS